MTIKEIAAKAGVSIATVSHVINHTRYVSPELVDKIEAIIEEVDILKKSKKRCVKSAADAVHRLSLSFQISRARSTAICAISCSPTRPARLSVLHRRHQRQPGRGEKHPAKLNLQCQDHRHPFYPRQAAIRLPIHFSMNPVSRLYVSNDSSMTMSLRGSFLITPKHFTPLLPIF